MSTNYYLFYEQCRECGTYKKFHIGHSAFGWAFAMHTIPGKIETWEQMEEFIEEKIKNENAFILNEYNESYDMDFMKDVINRPGKIKPISGDELPIRRMPVDNNHCIGHHPTLMIDYCVGVFR